MVPLIEASTRQHVSPNIMSNGSFILLLSRPSILGSYVSLILQPKWEGVYAYLYTALAVGGERLLN